MNHTPYPGHVYMRCYTDGWYVCLRHLMRIMSEKLPFIERVKGYKERFAKHKSFFSDLYPEQ